MSKFESEFRIESEPMVVAKPMTQAGLVLVESSIQMPHHP